MRRLMVLVTVAAMMALSGAALAHPRGGDDVCVSHEGVTIVDNGASDCTSRPTSTAVAVNNSFAGVDTDSTAVAVNNNLAYAAFSSEAYALDHCAATIFSGEVEVCF